MCVCVEFRADYDGNPPSVPLLNLGRHLCAPPPVFTVGAGCHIPGCGSYISEEPKAEMIGEREDVYI